MAKLQRTKAELINAQVRHPPSPLRSFPLSLIPLPHASPSRLSLPHFNAQNLFDLDVKPYPALQATQSELEQLEKIYALYKEYKEFQESMSSTLWGDLDIGALQRGAEDMEKAAKRFPKELKEIPTFKTVEARLISFKESLPLVVNLKNDAMKIRHWQKLQEVTGVMFDVTLKTLTLSNIFAMDLGRFTAQVRGRGEPVRFAHVSLNLAPLPRPSRHRCVWAPWVRPVRPFQAPQWPLPLPSPLHLRPFMLHLRSDVPCAAVCPPAPPPEQVEEIINEGVQEGKIENELAKIDASWRDNALVVIKYKKDGQVRPCAYVQPLYNPCIAPT